MVLLTFRIVILNESLVTVNEINPDDLAQNDILSVRSLTEALNERDFIIALYPK